MPTIMGTLIPIVEIVMPDGSVRRFVQNPVPMACPHCGKHQTMFSLEFSCPNMQEVERTMGFIQPQPPVTKKKQGKVAVATERVEAVSPDA